jgi:hypothetical protein
MDGAPEELVNLAREDLRSTRDRTALTGLGALEACHGSLARSLAHIQAAVARWSADPMSRGQEAHRAIERFQAELRIHAALHVSAGTLCAEWGRALGGPGGQAYSPTGGGVPPLLSGGRRVSVQA